MKKFEQIILFTFAISGVLSFYLMPIASLVFTASASVLAIIYIGFNVLVFSNKSVKQIFNVEVLYEARKNFLNRLTGYALSIAVVGIMFYILSWPGEKMMLLFGWVSLSIVSFLIFKKHAKNNNKETSNTLKHTLCLAFVSLILWTIPVDKYLELKYRSYPSYFEALKNYNKDPSNIQYQETLKEERQLMYFSK